MKKKLSIFILLSVLVFFTGCESTVTNDAKSACKNKLIDTYAKANDTTITKCVADYDTENKKVVYNFCINSEETLYSLTDNGDLAIIKKDDSFYYSFATMYKQIEMEVLEEDDRYSAFEFKGNELK